MATTFQTQTPTTGPARPATQPAGPGSFAPTIDPVRLLKQYKLWLVGAGIAGFALGIVAFILLRMFMPRYTATAYFEASPLLTNITEQAGGVGEENEMQMFMYTQVARMMSPSVLASAANAPQIRNDTNWAKKFESGGSGVYDPQAAGIALEDIIGARVIPDTVWVTLSATTSNKTDSATIANSVSNTYLDQLRADAGRNANEQIESLGRLIASARAEKEQLEQRARRLIGDNQITALENRQSESQIGIATLSPQVTAYRTERQSAIDRYQDYQRRLTAPNGVQYPDFLRADIATDPIVARHDQSISSYNTALRGLLEDFGPNHIQVRRMQSQINAAEIERAKDVERLMAERFQTLIEVTGQQIQDFSVRIQEAEQQLKQKQQESASLTALLQEYNTLKADGERKALEMAERQKELSDLQATIDRTAASRMKLLYRAEPPDSMSFPKWFIVIPATMVLVVGAVSGLILLREVLEQRIRMPADVNLVPRTRVLGVVPDISEDPSGPTSVETAVKERPNGVIAEQVRLLRTAIAKKLPESRGAVVVTSGLPGSGSSAIIAALARSCASIDEKVLVIDANMRRPRMHSIFGVPEGPGLGEVLAGSATLAAAAHKTDMATLQVLTVGASGSRVYERLNSDAMTRLVQEAKQAYQLVLIDAPPMTVAGDAAVLANRADGSVLVVRALSESRGLLARVRNQLGDARAEFYGVVVNGVKSSAGGYFRKNFQLQHQYHGVSGPATPKGHA